MYRNTITYCSILKYITTRICFTTISKVKDSSSSRELNHKVATVTLNNSWTKPRCSQCQEDRILLPLQLVWTGTEDKPLLLISLQTFTKTPTRWWKFKLISFNRRLRQLIRRIRQLWSKISWYLNQIAYRLISTWASTIIYHKLWFRNSSSNLNICWPNLSLNSNLGISTEPKL